MAENLKINVLAKTLGIKSLVDLRAGFQMVGDIASKVGSVITDLTGAFAEQEKQETQLNAVLKSTQSAAGLTAQEIKTMASGFQQVTTFGDEAILSAQNMLLTFTKIGKDTFPGATEAVLNMSQAMGTDLKSASVQVGKALNDPIKGMSALNRVGIQFSDAQKETIKTMQETGDLAGAQAVILKELETQFGGSAKAAADTFAGAMKQAQNAIGDAKEEGGRFIALIGKDLVKEVTKAVEGFNEFLKSTESMEKLAEIAGNVAGTFVILKDIAVELGSSVFKVIKDVVGNIVENFQDLTGASTQSAGVMNILSGVLKTITVALTIVGKFINAVVDSFFNVIKIVRDTIKIFDNFFKAITGKKKWSDVGDAVKNLGGTFKDTFTNILENGKEIIDTTIKEFSRMPGEIKNFADKMEKNYNSAYTKVNKTVKDAIKQQTEIIKKEGDIQNKIVEKTTNKNEDTVIKSNKKMASGLKIINKAATESLKGIWQDYGDSQLQTVNDIAKGTIDGFMNTFNVLTDESATTGEKVAGAFQAIGGAISGVMSAISKAVNDSFSEQLAIVDKNKNEELATIKNNTDRELELLEFGGKTKKEFLKDELSALTTKLATELDENEKARLSEQAANTQKQLDMIFINEQSEKAIQMSKEKFAKKEAELRKRQFEANKATQIANVWIQTAIGIATAWGTSMQLGPIAGPIAAGILTAVLLGVAGAQTGIIASRQAPAFENGGIMGKSGVALVGEGGAELVTLPGGSRVKNHQQTMSELSGGEQVTIIVENVHINANNPQEMATELRNLARMERGRR